MKNLTTITLLLLLAFTNCKKENTLEPQCQTTPKAETCEWTLESAEYVNRNSSDNAITFRRPVTSFLFNYDHKLKAGVYSQSAIDSNNYTPVGTYIGNQLTYNIGGGLVYVIFYEESKLILERILYSIDTVTYVTERNTFTAKN